MAEKNQPTTIKLYEIWQRGVVVGFWEASWAAIEGCSGGIGRWWWRRQKKKKK
jgi:hypothetical protein